jgi:hypothetical protein
MELRAEQGSQDIWNAFKAGHGLQTFGSIRERYWAFRGATQHSAGVGWQRQRAGGARQSFGVLQIGWVSLKGQLGMHSFNIWWTPDVRTGLGHINMQDKLVQARSG